MPHGGCQGLYGDPVGNCEQGGKWEQSPVFGLGSEQNDECCNEISAHLKNGLFEANLEVQGTTTCPTFIGDLTGASLNPARSIGPMLMSGNFENLLFYLVIPPIGCIISAYLFRFFINK